MRSVAEYLGGTRVRFTHPCGHSSIKDFSKGDPRKRMSASWCGRMAAYWGPGQGVNAICPKCYRVLTPDRRRRARLLGTVN